MNIFVTGFHRAGTHRFAQALAKKYSLPYLEENIIQFANAHDAIGLTRQEMPTYIKEPHPTKPDLYRQHKIYIKDNKLKNGFVLQCPGIAHKVLDLADVGKVYWAVRDDLNVINSMRNINMSDKAWKVMNAFHDEFPDDPIWDQLKYDGTQDVYYQWTGYYALMMNMKNHFYETKFKDYCKLVKLEGQAYYHEQETSVFKRPLNVAEAKQAQRYML